MVVFCNLRVVVVTIPMISFHEASHKTEKVLSYQPKEVWPRGQGHRQGFGKLSRSSSLYWQSFSLR